MNRLLQDSMRIFIFIQSDYTINFKEKQCESRQEIGISLSTGASSITKSFKCHPKDSFIKLINSTAALERYLPLQ